MAKDNLKHKLGGAFLGAALLTAPVYVVGSNVVENMVIGCFDFTQTSDPIRCVQDVNTTSSVIEVGMLFTLAGGGLVGWRRGKKYGENNQDETSSGPDTPEV